MNPRPATPGRLVSVVVPHLNQADQLTRCLESLQAQSITTAAFDIIVVDNGSAALPTDICGQFDNVRLITETVPGPGPARSAGASVSAGDILAFIDADCIADHRWLEAIVNQFTSDGGMAILGVMFALLMPIPEK